MSVRRYIYNRPVGLTDQQILDAFKLGVDATVRITVDTVAVAFELASRTDSDPILPEWQLNHCLTAPPGTDPWEDLVVSDEIKKIEALAIAVDQPVVTK